jgi:hypothetical protein
MSLDDEPIVIVIGPVEPINVLVQEFEPVEINLAPIDSIMVRPITQGERGPQGEAGKDAKEFNFEQLSPASTWYVNHNFGYPPSVTVFNSGGEVVEGQILHVTNNLTLIYFNIALSGNARCV